jgi:hypothetical protein
MPGSPRPVRRITRFLILIQKYERNTKEEYAIIIKGAPRHPLIKPKIMKKQMYYFFNLILIREF